MTEISELEHRLADALGRMRMAHQSTRKALSDALNRVAELEAAAQAQPAAAPAGDAGDIAALEAEIEATRAQLAIRDTDLEEERGQVSTLVQQIETDRAALQAAQTELTALKAADRLGGVQANGQAEETQERIGALEAIVGQLQKANAQLRQNNELLRQAMAEGSDGGALFDDSLTAEIESLKAARAADRAEIDSVLAALQPLIEETADA
ncbi:MULTISPECIES: hypothetical protein [unclassified Meridianimarinicoccus]|uniref:hypothetical protein n=1 Tax=unclassified Meridianimarinicoccus TaxID=2923344 RepID=UPI0018672F3C|nr:hypothetical protein [Fluviibacterium sp. MJW13]